jgi:hypothetical protein
MWNELVAHLRAELRSKWSPEEYRRITLESWGIAVVCILVQEFVGGNLLDDRSFVTGLVLCTLCLAVNMKRRRNQYRVSFWLFVAGLAIAMKAVVARIEIRPIEGPSLPYAAPIGFGVGALVWVLINVYEVLVARGEQK